MMPKSANEFVEQQLNERLSLVEDAFDSDALCIVGPLFDGVDDLIRAEIQGMQGRETRRARLAVMLTTPGGFIETVDRIVATFRHHYPDHVSFIVPNYAYSAGTVMVMSGDEIFMDYYSRLGPIDPQVETRSGRQVSALGYLKQWERLMKKAEAGELNTAEFQLMIAGFDQGELYDFEQARDLSISLLKEWLVRYKFKDWHRTETRQVPVTNEMREGRAEAIAKDLQNTDKWHSHGRGISMAVLQRDLNLKIDDLERDAERCERVKQYHDLLADYMVKLGRSGMLHTVDSFVTYLKEE